MYLDDGRYFAKDYSVSFGELVSKTHNGKRYTDFQVYANTWTDWHLLSTTRQAIVSPEVSTKYVDIPGSDFPVDMTTWLTGRPQYGMRTGSLQFIVDNDHEHWTAIREKMIRTLHGKKLKMRLTDDPSYYYEGRFAVGNWETGVNYSSISISYRLYPYKYRINEEGSTEMIWDTFNFDKDVDYSAPILGLCGGVIVNGTAKYFTIHANDYPFCPVLTWLSGNIVARWEGKSWVTLNSAGTATLEPAELGDNTLVISTNSSGSVFVSWRGGSL